MKKFNFGEIPISIDSNENLSAKEMTDSRGANLPPKFVPNSINILSSFYQKANNPLSPENKQRLNNALIGLTIAALGANIAIHVSKKEADFSQTIPDISHSFKLDSIPKPSGEKTEALSFSENEPDSTYRPHHFPKPKNLPPSLTQPSDKNISITKNSSDTGIEIKSLEKSQSTVSERVQNIADEVQIIAAVLTKNEKLYPRKMFTEELSIAQKIVESGLKINAKSNKGSVGETQVQPITMKECIRYANILSGTGDIQTSLPDENKITEKDISEMITLVKSSGDYANAFKDIYLIDLLNNHRIGKKEFARGNIDGALKKILAAYNWNPTSFKKYENQEHLWPEESQKYHKKIFHCMKIINRIKNRMTEMKMLTGIYDLSPILTLEIKKYERELDKENPGFDETIERVMQGYLDIIFEMENIKEKPLEPEEIKRLINKFNPEVYRDYKNYIASISKKARL